MASVQFYGKEKAIAAYKNCQIPAWGLFVGKQLLCRYNGNDMAEGEELLTEFLDKIEGSIATYTLKVFELGKGQKVKEKTECDSSFNFKIPEYENYTESSKQLGYFARPNNDFFAGLDNRLKDIEQKIGNTPEVEEEEEQTFINAIGTALQSAIINAIENPSENNIVHKIIGLLSPNQQPLPMQPAMRPVAIGKVEDNIKTETMPEQENKQLTEQDLQRIGNALDIMHKSDPEIVEHLEKLAAIADKNPKKFRNLLLMLETFS